MVRTKSAAPRSTVAAVKMDGARIGVSTIFTNGVKTYSATGKPRKKDGARRLRCTRYKGGCKGSAILYVDETMSEKRMHTCRVNEDDIEARKYSTELKQEAVKGEKKIVDLQESVAKSYSKSALKKRPLYQIESNLYKIKKRTVPPSWRCPGCEGWIDKNGKPSLLLPCEHSLCNACVKDNFILVEDVCPKCKVVVKDVVVQKDFPDRP